jgi:hypothetical protein
MQKHQSSFAAILALAFAVPVCAAKPPAGAPPGGGPPSQTNSPSAAGAAPSAQGPSASTASFESQMLAYTAIDKISKKAATEVCDKFKSLTDADRPKNMIVIYDQVSFATTMSYSAFAQNAAALVGAYGSLAPRDKDAESGSGRVGTAAGGSGTSLSYSPVSDLTGLLQAVAVSANTETYGSVVIPDAAVAIALTRELIGNASCRRISVVYPPLFGQGSYGNIAAKNIQGTIDDVNAARRTAHNRVTAALTTGTSVGPAPASPSYYSTALADIDVLYDNFINSLLQPNSSTGVLGSAAVVQGKALTDLLTDHAGVHVPAFVLLATVVAAGGTMHDHKTFWTALTTGDKFTFSGGAIVAVSLWQASPTANALSPAPVYSDVIHVRTDFENSSQINSQ